MKDFKIKVGDIIYNNEKEKQKKQIVIKVFTSKLKIGAKHSHVPYVKVVPYEKYKHVDLEDLDCLEQINEEDIEELCVYNIESDSRFKVVKIEAVDHPPHYNDHPSGVECIEINEWMDYNLGNAWKYVFRHKDKKKPIQDLEKAIWYLKRAYEQFENRLLHYCTQEGQRRYNIIYKLYQKVWNAEPCPITAEALEYIFKLQARRPDDEPTCGNLFRNAVGRIELLIDNYKKEN